MAESSSPAAVVPIPCRPHATATFEPDAPDAVDELFGESLEEVGPGSFMSMAHDAPATLCRSPTLLPGLPLTHRAHPFSLSNVSCAAP